MREALVGTASGALLVGSLVSVPGVASAVESAVDSQTESPAAVVVPDVCVPDVVVSSADDSVVNEPVADDSVVVDPVPSPSPTVDLTLEPTPESSAEPTPEASPTPEVTVEPTPEPTVELTPTPVPTMEPEPEPSPSMSPVAERVWPPVVGLGEVGVGGGSLSGVLWFAGDDTLASVAPAGVSVTGWWRAADAATDDSVAWGGNETVAPGADLVLKVTDVFVPSGVRVSVFPAAAVGDTSVQPVVSRDLFADDSGVVDATLTLPGDLAAGEYVVQVSLVESVAGDVVSSWRVEVPFEVVIPEPAPIPTPSPSGEPTPTPTPTPSPSPSVDDSAGVDDSVVEVQPSPEPTPTLEPSPEPGVVCASPVDGVSAVAGMNTAAVSWEWVDGQLSDGDVAFFIQVTGDVPGAGDRVIEVPGDAREWIVDGLRNGVEYSFAVHVATTDGSTPPVEIPSAKPSTGVEGEVAGVIVTYAPGAQASDDSSVPGAESVEQVGLVAGGKVTEDAQVIEFTEAVDADTASEIASELAAQPGVVFAEPDMFLFAAEDTPDTQPDLAEAVTVPDDPEYSSGQWNLWDTYGVSIGDGTQDMTQAWEGPRGDGVTVAVIDTGMTPHPDLDPQLVAGYDFVSSPEQLASSRQANAPPVAFDGDYVDEATYGVIGRDDNPADPGDWRLVAPFKNSGWHGTKMAGVIAAAANNGEGITGIAPNARIQPVRALSWRGGLLSDIAAAITWASGGTIEGVPANATPSKVINLSFAVQATCPATLAAAIEGANNRGSIVVAAAGNAADDAGLYAPANCPGVITVGASTRDGQRANYSNYGPTVDVSAPGGEAGAQVLTTTNTGSQAVEKATYAGAQGTSVAAAHVSGAAAILASRNASLTPDQAYEQLTGNEFTKAFASETCDAANPDYSCGTGILSLAQIQTVASGDVDYAMTFNGSSQYAISVGAGVGVPATSASDLSVMAWIRPSETCSATCTIAKVDGTWKLEVTSTKVQAGVWTYLGSGDGWKDLEVTYTLPLDAWTHVASTYDYSTGAQVLYINGQPAATSTSGGDLGLLSRRMAIAVTDGGDPAATPPTTSLSAYAPAGAIDEVKVFGSLLGQTDIASAMHTYGMQSFSDPLVYYDFNEGPVGTTGTGTVYNRVSGAASTTNLRTVNGPTYTDVKQTTSNGNSTVVTFPRSYLTAAGGWRVPEGVTNANALIVGGGGGGGGGIGGGGGAGELIERSVPVVSSSQTIVVGVGGSGGAYNIPGSNGGSSIAFGITAGGGGGGAAAIDRVEPAPSNGASGGGGVCTTDPIGDPGDANASGGGLVNAGGDGSIAGSSDCASGGGGGASSIGGNASSKTGGQGGSGFASSITGQSIYYAGGGGGGVNGRFSPTTPGSGGLGGGGNGGPGNGASNGDGLAALSGTGSGGGGGSRGSNTAIGGDGGSGVVIVSYSTAATYGADDLALTLNGTSQYAQAIDSAPLGNKATFTAEAWFNPSDPSCASICVIMARTDDYIVALKDGELVTVVYSPISSGWRESGFEPQANAWNHVALVRSGSSVIVYVNGQEAYSATVGSSASNNTIEGFFVGANCGSVSGTTCTSTELYFPGVIDEVRFFSTARTQAQVEADMHTYGPVTTTGLVAYYDFNEGIAGTSGSGTVINRAAGAASSTNLTTVNSPTYADVKVETTAGDNTVVTFPRSYLTAAGGWQVPSGVSSVDALVVGGGGGGGEGTATNLGGGGGGGGQVTESSRQLTAGAAMPVTVGTGGLGGGIRGSALEDGGGVSGTNSEFDGLTAVGGGGGGSWSVAASSGASGGGGGSAYPSGNSQGANGTAGGNGGDAEIKASGGGGGAGGDGADGSDSSETGGIGGVGSSSSIAGTPSSSYGAGGGGGYQYDGGDGGDLDGPGAGGVTSSAGIALMIGGSAAANSGAGGGGGAHGQGGSGGSGVVIVSYTTASVDEACAPEEAQYTSGGTTYRVVAFKDTGSCTWTVPAGVSSVDYLVVGGGGGGGSLHGGGGGAGGLSEGTFTVAADETASVVVGSGGAGGDSDDPSNTWSQGRDGGKSVLTIDTDSVTADGGGGGGSGGASSSIWAGRSGASGGGSAHGSVGGGGSTDGNDGGDGYGVADPTYRGGGGGGASAAGNNASISAAGNGGAGLASSIVPVSVAGLLGVGEVADDSVFFAGGGGGGTTSSTGGVGGGGSGTSASVGISAQANTGGGGGGAGQIATATGGSGGSGVVVLRYVQPAGTACTPLTYGYSDDTNSYTVVEFQGAGECDWTVPGGVSEIDVLAVGGGGGGGGGNSGWGNAGGGGGGGGVATDILTGVSGSLSVVVGAGGAGGLSGDLTGSSGTSSSVSDGSVTVTATGGVGGVRGQYVTGGTGGSGGDSGTPSSAGSSTARSGGAGPYRRGGGGGGAGSDGSDGDTSSGGTSAGAGGTGLVNSFSGAAIAYGGGGGGGNPAGSAAPGGIGGGAVGAYDDGVQQRAPGSGTDGLGGGGGGATDNTYLTGGDGGDGVVIVRYVNEPDAPTSVVASIDDTPAPNQVTLSWSAPSYVGVGSITGYEVLISADDTSSFGPVGAGGSCDDSNVVQTACTVTGLDTGRTYYFEVKTRTLGGSTVYVSEASSPSNGVVPFGPLAKFAVTGVPSGGIGEQTAGSAFSMRVTALDDSDQVVLSYDDTVAVTSTSAISAGGGSVGPLVNGVLDDSITLTAAGSQTITATGGGQTGSSASFTVRAAAPVVVSVTTAPSVSSKAGVGFVQQPVVQVEDTYGNLVDWDDTTLITVTASPNAVLSDDTAVTSSGVASFAGLSVDDSAGSYVLTFTASGLGSGDDTASVTITPGVVAVLDITINDANPLTVSYTRTLTATLSDAFGNVVTDDDTSVVAFTQSGAGGVSFPPNADDSTSVAVGSGVAAATITGATSGLVSLTATVSGSSPAVDDSLSLTVVSGEPAKLSLTQNASSPSGAGEVFTTQPQVTVLDANDNPVTTDDSTVVTVGVSSGGTLIGDDTAVAVNGVVSFSGLGISGAPDTYTLTFSAPGLGNVTQTVVVEIGAAASLNLANAASGATYGSAFTAQPVVQVLDAAGNVLTGDDTTLVTAQVKDGSTVLQSVTATASNGVATFSGVGADDSVTAGTFDIVYSSGALADDSQPITVAKADLLVTATSPSVTYGSPAPVISPVFTGFKYTDDSTVLSAQPTCSSSYDDTDPAGSAVPTSCSGAAAANYTFTYQTGAIAVSKAPVTITASDDSVAYLASSLPAITYTASGLVNGEDTSVFTTQPTCSVSGYDRETAVAGDTFSTSCSGAAALNYAFTYSSGTLTVIKAEQAALSVSSTSGTFGTVLSLTTSGGSGTGAVSFVAVDGTASGCVVTDDTLVSGGAGTCLVTATQSGDANYNAVSSAQTTVMFAKDTPTTGAFGNVTRTYGSAPFQITPPTVAGAFGADLSNAGTWAYTSSDSAVATVMGDSIDVGATGSATITGTFTPTDDTDYTTATATMTVTVNKATQSTLSISSPNSFTYGTSLTLVTTGGSGSGAITFTATDGTASDCTVTGTVLTASSTGTCTVGASKAGDSNYLPATASNVTVTVVKADQTVSFTTSPPLVPRPFGTYSVAATATSGLSVTLSVTTGSPAVCQLTQGVVTFNAAGTCVITATQPGDGNYNAAVDATQTIVVGALNQSITFAQPADKDFNDPAFALTATASSGLPVTFARDLGQMVFPYACSVDDTGIVTIAAVGPCAITVSQAGNAQYAAASNVTRVFQVNAVPASAPYITSVNVQNAGATLTFTAPGFDGGSNITAYQVNAIPANGGAVVSESGCSASGSPLTCTMTGLVNGTAYRFTVQAITAAGLGAASDLVPAATDPAITSAVRANAVSGLTAQKGNTQLTARWQALTVAQLGGGTFTQYVVSLAQSATPSTVDDSVTLSDRLDDSHVFTGLDNGTSYTITVVAITTANSSAIMGNTAIVTEIPARAPDPVAGSYVPTSGRTGVVSWPPPVSDGGSPVLEYRIRLTPTGGGAAVFDDTVGSGVFSQVVTGLTRGQSYDVTMTVTNDVGSSDDTTDMRQPDRPAPPVITAAVPVSVDDSTGFEVTWTAPADNGAAITGYQVTATRLSAVRSASSRSASLSLVGAAAADDTQFTCSSSTTECVMFAPGSVRDYAFVVVADNLAGASAPSAPFVVPDPTPPTPPVGPSSPKGVRAWAMTSAAMVTWTPPTTAGSFPVSTYKVTSSPGGMTCLAPAAQLWCEVSGLRNGTTYTFTVTALTGAGWSEPSDASNPVTPSVDPEPGPAPGPQPVPGPVPPGSVVIDLDGATAPGATGGPNAGKDGIEVTGPGYGMDLSTLTSGGSREPLATNGELQVKVTGRISVSGDGALPGSTKAVWAIPATVVPQARAAREPVLIGTVVVGESGAYAGSWPVPVTPGEYLLQVVATPAAGGILSASTPLVVLPDDAYLIILSGTRNQDGAGKRVNVQGMTTNLDGATVQARVKLSGETRYSDGSTRTVVNEAFTWTRIANRKVYVYFQTELDTGETIRSARITIPAPSR